MTAHDAAVARARAERAQRVRDFIKATNGQQEDE